MTEFIGTYGNALSLALIFGIVGLSMWLVMAQGVFSLAAAGLMAVGAYTSAWVTVYAEWPVAAGVIAGGLAAAAVAWPLAKPVMRLRVHYMAIVTLGFALIVSSIITNWQSVTGGALGFYGIPPMRQLWVHAVLLLIFSAIASLAYRSHLRRAMYVVGLDETVAEASGIRVTAYRTTGFVVAGLLAGIAGGLFAHQVTVIQPQSFTELLAFDILAFAVLGGIGHWSGPIVGAFLLLLLPEVVRGVGEYREVAVGLVLLGVILWLPGGLVQPRVFRSLVRSRSAAELPARPVAAPIMEGHTRIAVNQCRLEVVGLGRRFGAIQAVDDVSLELEPGTICGVIGPNGSGKSTFLNLIGGQIRPDSGSIVIGGEDVTERSPAYRARLGVSRTYQEPRINPQATISDNVLVGTHVLRQADPLSILARTHRARREETELRAAAERVMADLDLLDIATSYGTDLSYGQQRLVEFARCLVASPRVLLLDEPTSGVNDRLIDVFATHIRALGRAGMTVLVVEHNIDFVMAVCDRVFVFDVGRLIFSGTPREAREDEGVFNAYLGGPYEATPEVEAS